MKGKKLLIISSLIMASMALMAVVPSCKESSYNIAHQMQALDTGTGYDRATPVGQNIKVNRDLDMSAMAGESMPDEGTMHNLEMWTTNVARGSKAFDLMKASDPNTPAPPDGQDYVIIDVHASFTAVASSTRWFELYELILNAQQFNAYPGTGTGTADAYANTLANAPNPQLNFDLHAGESDEGYLVFVVPTTDTTPVMFFNFMTAQFWFKLY